MKVPQMIAAEFRRLTSTRMSVIALIALVAVPVLYGGLYLWANQDPYAKFPEVPVALVVADEGSPATDDSPARNVGDEVADELMRDHAFDWHRTTAAEAHAGLAASEFDFVITIPADFSDALASVGTSTPRQAELTLETNDANSYLAGTIGKQAIEQIRTTIAQQVGREAASLLLDSISTIRGNLVEAADGASQLDDGATRAADGATQLGAGAAQLADGTAQLAAGNEQLASGSEELAAGADQVAAGNAQLAASADRVGAAVGDATAALPAGARRHRGAAGRGRASTRRPSTTRSHGSTRSATTSRPATTGSRRSWARSTSSPTAARRWPTARPRWRRERARRPTARRQRPPAPPRCATESARSARASTRCATAPAPSATDSTTASPPSPTPTRRPATPRRRRSPTRSRSRRPRSRRRATTALDWPRSSRRSRAGSASTRCS